MFFLSKLLPLFIYPLGLSSLLIALGLFLVVALSSAGHVGYFSGSVCDLFFSSNPAVSKKAGEHAGMALFAAGARADG